MSIIDWTIVALFLGTLVTIGYFFSRNKATIVQSIILIVLWTIVALFLGTLVTIGY